MPQRLRKCRPARRPWDATRRIYGERHVAAAARSRQPPDRRAAGAAACSRTAERLKGGATDLHLWLVATHDADGPTLGARPERPAEVH